MIKYNNNTIYNWNFDASNIIKVYRNNAIVFYKVSGDSPTPEYKVCFAVVDDITQYQETEFEDVYDKATDKWYKLNNLNQYEEYGVYGSGRTECSGGTSRLPQGYTEVEYIENTSTAYIDTGAYIDTSNFEIGYTISDKQQLFGYCHQGCGNCTWLGVEQSATMWWGKFDNNANLSSYLTSGDNTIIFTQSGATINGTSILKTLIIGSDDISNVSLPIFARYDFKYNTMEHRTDSYMQLKSFYLKNNGTLVRDLVPAKRDSDSKYGMYDLVTNTFYLSPNDVDFSGGVPVTPTDCVTTYKGKLTIDDGYEYEWNGSSWVNVGEVTGSTASLPNVPFSVNFNAKNYDSNSKTLAKTSGQLADVDAVITAGTPTVHDGYLTIASGTRATISGYSTYFNRDSSNPNMTIVSKQRTDGNNCHMFSNRDSSYNWMYRCYSNKLTLHGGSETGGVAVTTQPVIESVRVNSASPMLTYNNYTDGTSSTTASFSYNSTNSGKFAMFQGYATDTGEYFVGDFYWVYMSQNTLTDEQVQQVIAYNEGGGQSEYPKYYSEKSDPLNDLTFNTLAEAQTYAYNNCVYDGMRAVIDGDSYYFDSSDENGWVKILEYYKVEDVTPNAASGWTISGSSTYNPNSSYYDDFDLETSSTSNVTKIAKVTIYGYNHFTYYLRSGGYSNYCYAVATNVDEVSTPPSTMSYNSASAITNTYSFSKAPKSDVNLSNYRRVTYNNLNKTVEHTFYVYFYGRKYSSYVGTATILIPKEQTNENWEQVTFSASSNVASSQKYLYIDNNNSTSGGTSYWYYRWIVGLPSGSHSSYTNYSSYDYCPNVNSSSFTSVASEQRQVEFTYDSTTNKQLTMRLVDTSGNTLAPSNTVYYTVYRYNACNYQSNQSITITNSSYQVYFKEGGRFSLNDGSSRYYIYGYTPPTMGTTYYVDNYQSTFDIVYTKLTDEAVAITYTTYDPNDSETPAFNTDITYPYNGGTTSSTTLTSFDVPYTYSYTVTQTSNMFYAANQVFTASQASRTVTFTLYPNNREFATVADMEAYQYVWEGMKAIVGDTKYQYKNGVWTEASNTELEYIQCGGGTNSTNGGLQLLTNVTADYYFEVEAQCVVKSTPPMLVGEKSSVEVVSYQLGLCYYSNMFLDYGGGRLNTNINSTTQNERHTYGAGHISGSSYQNVVGVKLDGVVKNTTNATTRVEGLPYLVGCGVGYTGHSASDVSVGTNTTEVAKLYSIKIYKDYGDTLVGDYIPVINSDDVVTLYDKVSGNYATPYGTLIAGPEKT